MIYEINIKGEKGSITLAVDEIYGFPNETSHYGGYDAKGTIEIKSRNYYVKDEIWFTTGEIYYLFESLEKAYNNLTGDAEFCAHQDGLFKVNIKFVENGKVQVYGTYQENYAYENELMFSFNSDQSYFEQTLRQLKEIVNKYGDLKGKR